MSVQPLTTPSAVSRPPASSPISSVTSSAQKVNSYVFKEGGKYFRVTLKIKTNNGSGQETIRQLEATEQAFQELVHTAVKPVFTSMRAQQSFKLTLKNKKISVLKSSDNNNIDLPNDTSTRVASAIEKIVKENPPLRSLPAPPPSPSSPSPLPSDPMNVDKDISSGNETDESDDESGGGNNNDLHVSLNLPSSMQAPAPTSSATQGVINDDEVIPSNGNSSTHPQHSVNNSPEPSEAMNDEDENTPFLEDSNPSSDMEYDEALDQLLADQLSHPTVRGNSNSATSASTTAHIDDDSKEQDPGDRLSEQVRSLQRFENELINKAKDDFGTNEDSLHDDCLLSTFQILSMNLDNVQLGYSKTENGGTRIFATATTKDTPEDSLQRLRNYKIGDINSEQPLFIPLQTGGHFISLTLSKKQNGEYELYYYDPLGAPFETGRSSKQEILHFLRKNNFNTSKNLFLSDQNSKHITINSYNKPSGKADQKSADDQCGVHVLRQFISAFDTNRQICGLQSLDSPNNILAFRKSVPNAIDQVLDGLRNNRKRNLPNVDIENLKAPNDLAIEQDELLDRHGYLNMIGQEMANDQMLRSEEKIGVIAFHNSMAAEELIMRSNLSGHRFEQNLTQIANCKLAHHSCSSNFKKLEEAPVDVGVILTPALNKENVPEYLKNLRNYLYQAIEKATTNRIKSLFMHLPSDNDLSLDLRAKILIEYSRAGALIQENYPDDAPRITVISNTDSAEWQEADRVVQTAIASQPHASDILGASNALDLESDIELP